MRNLHIYILVSDRGSNEVRAKKIWATLARDCPQIVIFPMDCLEHQSHLITLQSLRLADALLKNYGANFKYFSSLAIFCNTMRDSAKNLFLHWCKIHGDTSGVRLAKTLWPKLTGGRWNSCHEVEQRMMKTGGRRMAEPVVLATLTGQKQTSSGEQADADQRGENDYVDDVSYEETKAHTRKMGQWRANTLKFVQQSLWWVIAEAMNTARGPNFHMSVAWLMFGKAGGHSV